MEGSLIEFKSGFFNSTLENFIFNLLVSSFFQKKERPGTNRLLRVREVKSGYDQNTILRPNWILRRPPPVPSLSEALLAKPVPASSMNGSGTPKSGWLKTLKNSARNCTLTRSPTFVFLNRPKLPREMLSPNTELRATSP